MSALDTTFEEVKSEEVKTEEDTYIPEVYEIKWGKKVHPNGLVAFIAKLHDAHVPLSHIYIRVYTDLIYSFLREHEDKDVLVWWGCGRGGMHSLSHSPETQIFDSVHRNNSVIWPDLSNARPC